MLSSGFKVISGQQLPKVNIKEDSIVDPLVRVEIHGVPMDQAKQETRYIENNGIGKAHVLASVEINKAKNEVNFGIRNKMYRFGFVPSSN